MIEVQITKFDNDCYAGRSKHLKSTKFKLKRRPTGGYELIDLDTFNTWKGPYEFSSRIEAITWAWRAWEFKTGRRSFLD